MFNIRLILKFHWFSKPKFLIPLQVVESWQAGIRSASCSAERESFSDSKQSWLFSIAGKYLDVFFSFKIMIYFLFVALFIYFLNIFHRFHSLCLYPNVIIHLNLIKLGTFCYLTFIVIWKSLITFFYAKKLPTSGKSERASQRER